MFRRDALIHVFAADCLEENGKIVILGQSIDQWNGDNVGFSGGNFFSNRLHINHMTSVINIESPDTAKVFQFSTRSVFPCYSTCVTFSDYYSC